MTTDTKSTPAHLGNPLHDYKNVGYRIYLSILTQDELNLGKFNSLSLNNRVIACSSNMIDPDYVANEIKRYIPFEILIKDMTFSTAVGVDPINKAVYTSFINMEMMEPMGSGFLEIMMAAQARSQEPMKFTQAPYLITIEFYGYNAQTTDRLQPRAIAEFTKYIPVRFLTISSTLTSSGTKHMVSFIPYAQHALNNTVNNQLNGLTIRGSTVGELLTSYQSVLNDDMAKVSKAQAEARGTPDTTAKRIEYVLLYSGLPKEIADSPLTDEYVAMRNTPMATGETDSTQRAEIKAGEISLRIQAKESVTRVIREIILNSVWYKNTYLNNEQSKTQSPIWLIPKIYTFTEIKKPWSEVYNDAEYIVYFFTTMRKSLQDGKINYDLAPQSVINEVAEFKKTNLVRDYDYLFTGKNVDILELDIKYDFSFYHKVLTYDGKYTAGAAQNRADGEPPDVDNNDKKAQAQIAKEVSKANPSPPLYPQTYVGDTAKPIAGESDFLPLLRNQLENLFDNYAGQFTQINMTIVGDPCFLTDYLDSFESFRTKIAATDTPFLPVGKDGHALINWSADCLIRINVNRPTKIDKNGVPQLTVSKLLSRFYRVLKVEHRFSGGKFTQLLMCNYVPVSQFKQGEKRSQAEEDYAKSLGDWNELAPLPPPSAPKISNQAILAQEKLTQELGAAYAKAANDPNTSALAKQKILDAYNEQAKKLQNLRQGGGQ